MKVAKNLAGVRSAPVRKILIKKNFARSLAATPNASLPSKKILIKVAKNLADGTGRQEIIRTLIKETLGVILFPLIGGTSHYFTIQFSY
jgi:hypothetical protein